MRGVLSSFMREESGRRVWKAGKQANILYKGGSESATCNFARTASTMLTFLILRKYFLSCRKYKDERAGKRENLIELCRKLDLRVQQQLGFGAGNHLALTLGACWKDFPAAARRKHVTRDWSTNLPDKIYKYWEKVNNFFAWPYFIPFRLSVFLSHIYVTNDRQK